MIVCVPANFTATTISAVSVVGDIGRYVYGCLGCSAECGRCARTIDTFIDEALGTLRAAYCAGCPDRCDRARCYPTRFFWTVLVQPTNPKETLLAC
jgi:bacterioferritin-associated ferredoxin